MTLEEALRLVDEAVFEQTGRHLNEAQDAVVRGTWHGQSYEAIAATNSYTPDYLKKDVGPKLWQHLSDFLDRRVGKKSFRPTMESLVSDGPSVVQARQDWGDGPDVSVFYGRDRELQQLKDWVESDARLIALLGMGGIGKTSLSIKLAQQLQDRFDCLIWRSLRNAPPFDTLASGIVQFLAVDSVGDVSTSSAALISDLLDRLRERKCLLVLDNLESIFQESNWAGRYLHGYEAYGELFAQLGRSSHQSCLILTSREKPQELEAFAANQFVKAFQVSGLPEADARKIFASQGALIDEVPQQPWLTLNDRYGGNPLALKLVAVYIRDLYGGDIAAFLADRTDPLGIRDLIQAQLDRLSPQELEIVYWLAISCRPVALSEVRRWVVTAAEKVANAFQSLQKRYLIEHAGGRTYTQQPVVMEYVIGQFCDRISEEIASETTLTLFHSHALLQAEEKDYIRNNQDRLILERVKQTLLAQFGTDRLIEKLRGILERKPWGNAPGYGTGNLLNLLQALQADLSGWDFSNLTIWQADLQDADLQNANFQGSNLSGCVFAKPFGSALVVALGSENRLATGDAEGQILLWQVETGQQHLACQGKFSAVRSLAFSPTSHLLASAGQDSTIRLWHGETGECLRVLSGHTRPINCLAFSADGAWLASGSNDGTVRLWNLQGGLLAPPVLKDLGRVRSVAFSPDGDGLAVGYQSQGVGLLQLKTGQWHPLNLDRMAKLWAVAFDQDCRSLLHGLDNLVNNDAPKDAPAWVAIAIASDSDDNTLTLFDIQTGDPLKKLQGHTDFIQAVAFSQNGHWVASSSSDRTLRFWEASTGQCHQILKLANSLVRCLALSPEATLLASSSEERLVQLWDIKAGQCLRRLQSYVHRVWCFAFSPDNRTVASGSDDGGVRLFNASSGRCLRTLKGFHSGNPNGHQDWVYALAFSPEGSLLASGSYDQTIRLWQTDSGEFQQKLRHPQGAAIQALAFSPDGEILACASDYSQVYLWSIDPSRPLPLLAEEPLTTLDLVDGIKTLAFSPDGQRLATSSDDGRVQQWQTSSGQCLDTWEETALDQIYAVRFTSSQQLVVVGRCDRTIQIWDVATNECWKTLDTEGGTIDWVSLSADLRTLASGNSNDIIQLWDLETCDLDRSFKVGRPYEGMNIVGVSGITPAQQETLIALGATDY